MLEYNERNQEQRVYKRLAPRSGEQQGQSSLSMPSLNIMQLQAKGQMSKDGKPPQVPEWPEWLIQVCPDLKSGNLFSYAQQNSLGF